MPLHTQFNHGRAKDQVVIDAVLAARPLHPDFDKKRLS